MPIKGLTDRKAKQSMRSGRTVRLGVIQKGEREGFGRKIKLYDRDYFVFKPAGGDKQLAELFEEAYGPKPTVIGDVRIPVGLAGNFNIEDCAWLTASRHTERGSVFMARSDGENIVQARNPENGKVEFHQGEMPHEENTVLNDKGVPCYDYKGNFYPWQQSFAIDLLLPDFNRICFENDAAGLGTVTLKTTSLYDITTLIAEYEAILNELTSLLANPLKNDYDIVRRYLPLRDFPLRLYRSTDRVTTPDYRKNADKGSRLVSTRSLLHWQLAPALSAGIQLAIDRRTDNLIQAVGQVNQLQAPETLEETNDMLFGKAHHEAPAPRQLPAPTDDYHGPDWEEALTVEVEAEVEEEAAVIEVPVEDLDPQVEDARNWLGEQIEGHKISLGTVAKALVITRFFADVDTVKSVVADAPEFEEMRAMGLTANLNKKYTGVGGKKIFDIAVEVGIDLASEEE